MVQLKSVRLTNFRGFKDHTVHLEPVSILVGQNNAGKSTFIDALRLASIAIRRIHNAQYRSTPEWLGQDNVGYGFYTSFDTIDFDFSNIHHNYNGEEPAKICLKYDNRSEIIIWLGRNKSENFIQIYHPSFGAARSRTESSKIEISSILVMPPIGLIIPHETRIAKSRIHEFMYGRLAARHFRNQLYELSPQYQLWRKKLEETWPGVKVQTFDSDGGENGKEFSLILREGPFASEAAWVGSGLQAWMQILWFVCRADKQASIVLDEPDVYLHADMQRKVAKIVLSEEFNQVIIATHSSEIISDVEPANITVVRKRERQSWKPLKRDKLQGVVDGLGSKHNLQLAKLASARKIVLFEGEDQKILSEISLKFGSDKYYSFSSIPSFDIGGVENIQQAIGAAKALYHSSDGAIPVYLFIDKDYRSEKDIQEVSEKCKKDHLILHCWSHKEIENFLIKPEAILRIIHKKNQGVSINEVQKLIIEAENNLLDYTLGAMADRWASANKVKMPSDAMKAAKENWLLFEKTRSRSSIISGKRLISEMSRLSKERWKVSFGTMTLCRSISIDELDVEITDVITMLTT